MKWTLLIIAVLFGAAPARAQQSAEDRFRSLPAEKQEELRRRFRELQSLPPAERAELRRNLERLDAMPPGDRRAVLENYRRFWEGSFQRLDTLLDELKTKEKKRGARSARKGKHR